jgi:hypothetical protein
MPKLFASPGDGGMMPPAVPPAVSEAPQDAPWGRAEDPDAEAVRAPWELP